MNSGGFEALGPCKLQLYNSNCKFQEIDHAHFLMPGLKKRHSQQKHGSRRQGLPQNGVPQNRLMIIVSVHSP